MAIHIGKKIKEELYQQGISVSAFAKKINRTRNVVYDIFERESVDTALLNKISLVLRVNFFSLYSEQKEYNKESFSAQLLSEPPQNYQTIQEQLKELKEQNELLQKEISYLKKINELLEKPKVAKKSVKKKAKK